MGSGNQHSSRPVPPGRSCHAPSYHDPAERAERGVVLAGAGRAAGAVERDVDLVDGVELVGRQPGQQTGHAGRRRGTDDEGPAVTRRQPLQREQRLDVGGVIARGHHRAAGLQVHPSRLVLRVGRGQHHHVGLVPQRPLVGQRDLDLAGERLAGGDEQDARHLRSVEEVAHDAAADDAVADDADAHQGRSVKGTSCQPPRCGGTPPRPRNRRTPAIIPATPTARSARRITLTMVRTLPAPPPAARGAPT